MSRQPQDLILIIDDEAEIRALLRSALEAEGFRVLEAANAKEAYAHLEQTPISLVTLDLNLAGADGLTIARELRAKKNTPIVMITGKGDAVDRIVGLELGADDYISKPFVMREVIARVRAVLRRYLNTAEVERETPQSEGKRYAFEGWSIDLGRREVRQPDGKPCELTTAEFNLLALLVQRPGRVLSRDELMDLLKGHEWTPMDRSIDALVARLRKKLEPDSERPQLVKTVRGIGYVFAGSAKKV